MVRAKRERYFAAMVEIMFNGAPDYRLTREVRRILALPIHEHILQVGWCPANESILNHLPSSLEPTNQLGSATWRSAVFVPFF